MARKKSDAWRLIKKDLPPERAIAAEPRLAGLEGNAPLRSILFTQYRLRARSSSAPRILDVLFLIALPYFMYFSFSVAAVMLCVFALPLSAFQTRLRPQPAGRRGLAAVLPFGIRPRLMEDLLFSRVTASDFAVAFWASRLYSPTLGDGRRFYEAGLALLWIGIAAGLIHDSPLVYILPFPLAFAAYHRTARGVSPYPALAAARRMARAYKAQLEWRLEPMNRVRAFFSLKAWRKLLRDVFVIVVPTVAGSLLLAFLIYLVRR